MGCSCRQTVLCLWSCGDSADWRWRRTSGCDACHDACVSACGLRRWHRLFEQNCINFLLHTMRHAYDISHTCLTHLQPRQFVRTCVVSQSAACCTQKLLASAGGRWRSGSRPAAVSSAEAPSPLCSAPTASRIAPSLTLMLAGLHAGLARKERTAWPHYIHVSQKHERHMRDSKMDGSGWMSRRCGEVKVGQPCTRSAPWTSQEGVMAIRLGRGRERTYSRSNRARRPRRRWPAA